MGILNKVDVQHFDNSDLRAVSSTTQINCLIKQGNGVLESSVKGIPVLEKLILRGQVEA